MQGEASGAGSGGSDRLGGLKAKVAGLSGLLVQLDAARASARRTRVGIVIVILLVFLGYGFVMYSAGKTFIQQEMPKLGAEVQARMVKLGTSAIKDLMAMAQRVAPVYREAAQEQLREEWPSIRETLVAEANTLVNNVQADAQEMLETRLTTMAERQKDRIMAEFKELDGETQDIVMENLEVALREATLNVIKSRIDKAEARLRKTHEKILTFLPEGEREPFKMRMYKIWDQFLLVDLKGSELIEE